MVIIAVIATLVGIPGFDPGAYERARVVRLAEAAVTAAPRTITAVRNPRSAGGPHDFSSDGDYWWPDPANPNGPYLAHDGLTNPDNFVAHRRLLIDMAAKVDGLAAAYKLTHDERFAAAAVRQLQAWFVDPETRMNPRLLYAQAVRGRYPGSRIGLIDAVHLAEPALAVEALRGSRALTPAAEAAISGWFREYLHWLRTSEFGMAESRSHTNHSTCWSLQVACFAHLVGDPDALAECRRRFAEFHLPVQMALDGSFPEELRRTKPYGYSLFHLDVMTALAVVLSTPGDDLLAFKLPDGRGIERGIEWLAPFVANKRLWLETVHRVAPGPNGLLTTGDLVKPDVMKWEQWPVRQPFLLFGALAYGRRDWLRAWQNLDPDPADEEVIRNFPVRQPVLWLGLSEPGTAASLAPDSAQRATVPTSNRQFHP